MSSARKLVLGGMLMVVLAAAILGASMVDSINALPPFVLWGVKALWLLAALAGSIGIPLWIRHNAARDKDNEVSD